LCGWHCPQDTRARTDDNHTKVSTSNLLPKRLSRHLRRLMSRLVTAPRHVRASFVANTKVRWTLIRMCGEMDRVVSHSACRRREWRDSYGQSESNFLRTVLSSRMAAENPSRERRVARPANMTAGTDVEFRESDRSQSLPVVNYASAIAKAVEWLGDRYLLAKPNESVHHRRSKLGPTIDPAPRTFELTRASIR
jgi:hypothetical protein